MFYRERAVYIAVSPVKVACSDFIDPYAVTFSYLISENVVFLVIADKSYPRKLAFSYLDELSKEFANTYGPKVEAVRKPYAFVGFGAWLFSFHIIFSSNSVF